MKSLILSLFIVIIFYCFFTFLNNTQTNHNASENTPDDECLKTAFSSEINVYGCNKNAIVVLTRGYDNKEKYNVIIQRNISIFDIYYSKLVNPENYDIIIVNEGNISAEHKQYIQDQTPNMKLIYLTISFYINNNINDLCPPTFQSNHFSNGYKNMCYLWSIDFLEYFKDYLYIIRIDEDCKIINMDNNILNNYKDKNIYFASAYFQGHDSNDVVVGMNDLFNNFIINNNIKQNLDYSQLKFPYTNLMIINIQYFRNNENIKKILNEIKESNCIFSNRWGDLPIWGYILTYLVEPKYYVEDKEISYYHESHSRQIN